VTRLAGKIALVFGAGSSGPGWGNGKATAVEFAREGAAVMCVDIRAEAAEETRAIIAGEGGGARAFVADWTKSDQVEAAVKATLQAFGRIDVLHNNVGIVESGGPVELDEAAWRRSLDVNLTGMFLACKHALPAMLRQGKGAIVNVSSIAGIRYTGYPYSAYYATKGAVNQFTVGLALQYAANGIRANAILPGLMNTPLIYQQIVGHHQDREAMIAARDRMSPTGKMGTAWDVAKAAAFLASDDAGYINGVCLPVDGGLTQRVG
jgi:NAD(P)-dependent dehydrogenase (short-subunit alcohol dehydrogenase family)